MSGCGCQGRRSGRVWFRGSDSAPWESVISRSPQICWECSPTTGGSQNCISYNIAVTSWTRRAVNNCVEQANGTSNYNAWGPISVYLAEPRNECGGVWDSIAARCRGRGATCGVPQNIILNRLFRLSRIQVAFSRSDNQPDPPAIRFQVRDSTRILHETHGSACPQVRITCEDECPPGTSEMCGCCCDCSPLLSEARSIQSALRNL